MVNSFLCFISRVEGVGKLSVLFWAGGMPQGMSFHTDHQGHVRGQLVIHTTVLFMLLIIHTTIVYTTIRTNIHITTYTTATIHTFGCYSIVYSYIDYSYYHYL